MIRRLSTCRLLPSCGLLSALALLALPTSVAMASSGVPSHNIAPSRSTLLACAGFGHRRPHVCELDARADINRAHRREGLAPITLPKRFASLSPSEQLLAVADAERVERGLPPALGLTRQLDADARAGAVHDTDPLGPPGYSWASNWASGVRSALFDDFVWMYDDGPGSGNDDCPRAGAPGCWGHRENILARMPPPIAMGAAASGTSFTELFVGGYNPVLQDSSDPLLSPNWKQLTGT